MKMISSRSNGSRKGVIFLLSAFLLMILFVASSVTGQPYDEGDDEGDEVDWAVGGAICLSVCAVFIIFLFVAIWVYKDAEARGESGVLWLLLVLLFPIIGLIVWFIVRPKDLARPGGYQQPMIPPQYPAYQAPPYQPPPQQPPQEHPPPPPPPPPNGPEY